jgi:hypothetical protein
LAKEPTFVTMLRKWVYIVVIVSMAIKNMSASEEMKLISLYPVPAKSSKMYVRLNTFGSGIASVELRNLIGRKIQEKKFPAGSDETFFEELDNHPNGVYVVVAKNANGKIIEISKFVLNIE